MNIKIILFFFPIFFISSISRGQVAINNDNTDPDASAILDIKSIDKGMLIPRMTASQRTSITTPATGLLVFDSESKSFWFYNSTGWTELTTNEPLEYVAANNLVRGNEDIINHSNTDFVFGSPQLDDDGNSNHNSRFFFDKSISAFRAGFQENNDWDKDSLGIYSFSAGHNTKASGNYSIAIGSESIASGNNAIAIGLLNTSTDLGSFAVGYSNLASGEASMAFGASNEASGNYSSVMGLNTLASGEFSTAFGRDNVAPSAYETVLGLYATNYTPSSTWNFVGTDRLFTIGNGTKANNRSDALVILKDGSTDLNGKLTVNDEIVSKDDTQIFSLKTNATGSYVHLDVGGSGHSSDSIYIGDYSNTSNEVIMRGAVGIGTNKLTDKLNVKGDMRLERTSLTADNSSTFTIEGSQITGSTFARIDFKNLDRDTDTDYVAASIVASNGLGSEDGDLRFYTTTSGDIGDFDNQVLRINKGGNVGIGTGSSNILQKFQVGTNGDGTKALANEWNTWSDQRLKRDFVKVDAPLQKLEKLNGYFYYWKKDKTDQSRQLGVIAQEIEAVFPEIVSTNTEGIKSVDYSKLTAFLIEVNKQQQVEIADLKKQVQKINQLEEMILKLTK